MVRFDWLSAINKQPNDRQHILTQMLLNSDWGTDVCDITFFQQSPTHLKTSEKSTDKNKKIQKISPVKKTSCSCRDPSSTETGWRRKDLKWGSDVPRSFSDLTSVSVPLGFGFLFRQLARKLCVLELGDGLVLQVHGEVCRRLADDQLCGGLVVSGHGGVLALVWQVAVFDSQCMLVFVHSVDDAFVEGNLLAALHPLQSGVGPVDLTGEADGLLLLSVDVLQRNHDPQTLLWATQNRHRKQELVNFSLENTHMLHNTCWGGGHEFDPVSNRGQLLFSAKQLKTNLDFIVH